jgi:hypothetical protein
LPGEAFYQAIVPEADDIYEFTLYGVDTLSGKARTEQVHKLFREATALTQCFRCGRSD